MLFRKMRRDLMQQKGAYTACIIVIAIGLMVYSSMSMVMDNLLLSRDSFYKSQNFADGFAEVEGIPYSQVARLGEVDGIKQIQGRLIKDVRVVMPDRQDNVYLRLVSVDTSQSSLINDVLLEKGIALEDGIMNLWVDNKFFEANHLELNQEIQIIADGKKKTFHVTGTGKNPEFIYAMRTTSDLMPTPETFGIGYVPLSVMKNLFLSESSVTNLVFTIQTGKSFDDVKPLLESELKPYGLKSIYPRKDQTSDVLLAQELSSLKATAKTMPVIFLSVAAMILYIMFKRMIELQRTQLGTLKAFGYTNKEILFHYLSYALVTGLIGGILGGLSGFALTGPYLDIYRQYYNMPGLEPEFSYAYFFLSLALALLFSLAAGYQGCKNILKLEAAEAMRPAAPPSGKNVILEKAVFFWQMLTVQGKMALRSMLRNKMRTAFLFIGIMFTFSLLALPWSFKKLSDVMLFDQFEKIETYDVKIPLAGPLPQNQAERELSGFPGVRVVETMAEIPVTLHHSWHEKGVVLLGIRSDSDLYHITDSKGNSAAPPKNGVLISKRLADQLQAEPGTLLTVESPYFQKPDERRVLPVIGVIPQNMGTNAYMEISALQDFLGQGKLATSIMLSVEEGSIPVLKEKYNDSKMINGIENRLSMLRKMQELMASYMGMIYSMFIFGIIIGFAIIYNTSVITLSERSRELASMMVLGMTPQEVLAVITFEQWFVSIFGILAGIPLTKAFLVGMADSVGNDVFGFTPELNLEALLLALIISILSILFAQKMAARKLRNLSLVEVLKSRE
ncbi:MAG: FtsX-like permease family protein [Peptococcaceae bacterium]|nr:FtsX-like permease family protein [Peptococcaceae bacterium]